MSELAWVFGADERDHALVSLEGIGALLRRMHGFRAAHLNFARPSLPIREGGDESWGTGEFDPEMLERLLGHTVTARQRVDGMALKLRLGPGVLLS